MALGYLEDRSINNRQLRYFVSVVDAGSLTSAAEQLYVAQPALGLQVRKLEAELGMPLLVRHSRGVEPTPAGRALYQHAVSILQSLDDARREVRALAASTPNTVDTIRFGITPSAMRLIGPNVMVEARHLMPGIFLSLTEELSFVLNTTLEAGELDAAFTYSRPNRVALSRTPLLEEDLLLVTAAEVERGEGAVAFGEAVQRDLVLAGERDVVRRLVDDTASRLLLPVNVVYETQSVPATRNLIGKGLASGIMPYGSAAEEIESGALVARRIVEPVLSRTLSLAQRPRAQPFHNEAEFASFLRQMLNRLKDRLGNLSRPIGEL